MTKGNIFFVHHFLEWVSFMGHTDLMLPHHRLDLSKSVVIFGGLLLTASAICSTLDMAGPVPAVAEEVQVLGDEGSILPADLDPHAYSCDETSQSKNPSEPASDQPASDQPVSDSCQPR
jgi:hypothetical protein